MKRESDNPNGSTSSSVNSTRTLNILRSLSKVVLWLQLDSRQHVLCTTLRSSAGWSSISVSLSIVQGYGRAVQSAYVRVSRVGVMAVVFCFCQLRSFPTRYILWGCEVLLRHGVAVEVVPRSYWALLWGPL